VLLQVIITKINYSLNFLNMKTIVFFFALMFVCVSAFPQWFQQNSGTTNTLNSVFFTDENTGYAVGDNGTIIKTIDGGDIWLPKISGTNYTLASVYFPSADTGYIVGYDVALGHVILKTNDSGGNWITLTSGFENEVALKSVYFTSNDVGYAVGNPINYVAMIKTIDGGNNWTDCSPINEDYYPYFLWDIAFLNDSIACTVGADYSNTCIFWTNNKGQTWNKVQAHPQLAGSPIELLSVSFINDTTFCVVGQSGTILIGNIGSLSTTYYDISGGMPGVWLYSVFFTSPDTGYIADVSIIKTTNGGTTWVGQYVGATGELQDIFFVNNDIGYVVGWNGDIFKTTNGGESVGINDNTTPNIDIIIYVDHLNQFVEINIVNNLSKSFYELYNIEGKLISKGEITQNKQKISIKYLPVGLYFIRVHNNDFFKTMKFISQ